MLSADGKFCFLGLKKLGLFGSYELVSPSGITIDDDQVLGLLVEHGSSPSRFHFRRSSSFEEVEHRPSSPTPTSSQSTESMPVRAGQIASCSPDSVGFF